MNVDTLVSIMVLAMFATVCLMMARRNLNKCQPKCKPKLFVVLFCVHPEEPIPTQKKEA